MHTTMTDVLRTTGRPTLLDPQGRELSIVPKGEPEIVAPKVEAETVAPAGDGDTVQMFERLARDPNASVEKIERLMALWERAEAKKAEAQFNAAMSLAQAGMKPVAADAENPQTKSRYASYAALDRALRPIYTQHGFALSFNTGDAPLPDYVRVLCDVTHVSGFAKPYKADMPADGKGAKGGDVMTKTHATGSAMSYGMRYLLKMIFNIAVGEDDDDGNAASAKPLPPAPEGYAAWWSVLQGVADEGFVTLEAAWGKSRGDFKNYLTRHNKAAWEDLKARALKVKVRA